MQTCICYQSIRTVFSRRNIFSQIVQSTGEGVLGVVPSEDLRDAFGTVDCGFGVDNTRFGIAEEVPTDQFLVGVAKNVLHVPV